MKIRSVRFEKRCRQPADFPYPSLPEIAFVGRSNVGKSSLMNVLLNRRRLVPVSSTPGKTRAVDFYCVNGAFRFVDLPGYGYAKVPQGMRSAWKGLVEAYLWDRETLAVVVWILDIRRDLTDLDRVMLQALIVRAVPFVPVCTKADKLSRNERSGRLRAFRKILGGEAEPVVFSAKTGLGKEQVWKRLRAALRNGKEAGSEGRGGAR